ncbi:MAG: hypothetical protein RL456_1857 [Pseudomonadota bacterium]|jgi:hypothetical protein
MKFRWSEWLTAAALVVAFSAFAAGEAVEPSAAAAADTDAAAQTGEGDAH